MSDYSCLVIGTTLKSRKETLLRTLRSISKHTDGLLEKKIISIDNFGEGIDEPLYRTMADADFEHILKPRRGMVKSFREGLDHIDTEWVLYVEDDVEFRFLPTENELLKIINTEIDDRECGIVGLTCGGYKDKHIDRELNNKDNYIQITEKLSIFKRFEEYRNDFYIEFPAIFIRTRLIKACFDKALEDKCTLGIENGLTKYWFDLGLNNHYHKVSLLKNPWRDGDSHLSINRYCEELMPVILLDRKKHVSGGHGFGFRTK